MHSTKALDQEYFTIVTDVMEKKPCVYCIWNNKTDKYYIGSTVNFRRRIRNHMNMLVDNKHRNKKLQNSWNKHGWRSFEIFILRDSTKEELIPDEQWCLDINKPHYNQCKKAGNTLGFKWTQERRVKQMRYMSNLPKSHTNKQRDALKQNKDAIKAYTERCKVMCENNKRAVTVINMESGIALDYPSILEAAIEIRTDDNNIKSRLSGLVKSPYRGRYIFEYKNK